MKNYLKPLGATLFVAFAIGGCSSDTANLLTPREALSGPFPVALPAPGDNLVDEEEYEICKVGGPGDFTYTITDKNVTPNTVTTANVSLADGECKVISYAGGRGQRVSVTENVPAGYTLSQVVVQVRTGSPYPGTVFTTRTESGPTVLDSIGANAAGYSVLRGVLATFHNQAIPATGSIGDFVWNDLNGNGVQDTGEPGLAGVTVTLGGAATATATSDVNGAYLFSGLSAGSYTVTVGAVSGFTASPSNQGGDPLKDSDGSPASVTLATNSSSDLSIDFGFVPIPPPPSGEIGDFVWKDANGNGVQDLGEAGFAGLTVTLGGAANATTTTDANGNYLFTGLSAGSYTVTIGTPSGYNASPSNQGGDPLKDSNGSPASVTLATNSSSNLSIDFGFVLIPPPTGGQGCSPGYWKQSQHFHSYPSGLTPTTQFSSIFENAFPGMTLLQVLSQGGGGLNALGRQVVAALLNSGNPNVSYDLTRAQVVSQFNAVYPGSNYDTLKNKLEGFNSFQTCPLN